MHADVRVGADGGASEGAGPLGRAAAELLVCRHPGAGAATAECSSLPHMLPSTSLPAQEWSCVFTLLLHRIALHLLAVLEEGVLSLYAHVAVRHR